MKYTFHEYAGLFPLIEGEEFKDLVFDIKEHGLLEPIWLYEGKIIDGRNRYRACVEAGVKPTFKEWVGDGNVIDFIISLNLKRRHLTASQKACVAVDALPFYEKEAKKRQGTRTDISAKLRESDKGKASDFAAKQFNVSARYIQEAKRLKEETPTLFEEVKAGVKNFSEVKKEEREVKKAQQREDSKKLEPPKGTFNLIVIDPPWEFQGEYDADGRRSVGDYRTMSFEEIKAIDLHAAKDCVLWVWGIDLYLKETLEVIDAWGFERKATLIWDKEKMGLGKWLRNQHEYCFLCVKGKPVFNGETFRSVLRVARGKHSAKPDEFYKLVEEASPYKAKLDYFARKQRVGWVCYGDEA